MKNPNNVTLLSLPLPNAEILQKLKIGDKVLLSGIIYTARDQAHKKMVSALARRRKLPFDLKGQAIYYVGPTPARPGRIVGAAGPTTAARIDKFAPRLYQAGIKITIGKGYRNQAVIDACKKNQAVYLAATGGAGAFLSKCIKAAKIIAYPSLGTEAVYKLYVENFPAVVVIDTKGNYLFNQSA